MGEGREAVTIRLRGVLRMTVLAPNHEWAHQG